MKKNVLVSFIFIILFFISCEDEIVIEKEYDAPTPFELVLPAHMPIMDMPSDNPLTVEGIRLGRKLFYDPILSADSTQSCASCHQQNTGFSDIDRFSIGIDKIRGTRRAMPIVNIGYMNKLFWDGRANGVEDQALGPVENPIEMHNIWEIAVQSLADTDIYPDLYGEAFGSDSITKERTVQAIAQFERTMISVNSKYDRVIYDKTEQFTDDELEGWLLFYDEEGGDCFHCHDGGLLTDNDFHNNGLDDEFIDMGLFDVTGFDYDIGKFKTPSLRNVALRAPYMHDGRFASLKEVLDHYSDGLKQSATVDPLMKNVYKGGVQLTEEEKWQIIAYLNTMTDTSFIQNTNFETPL